MAVHQASLSVGFPRQEHRNGLPFPSPGDLSDPGIKPVSNVSCFGRWVLLPLSHQVRPFCLYAKYINIYSITNLIDMNLGKLREIVEVREDWSATLHRVAKSRKPLSSLTINIYVCVCVFIFQKYDILLKGTFHYLLPNLLTQIVV